MAKDWLGPGKSRCAACSKRGCWVYWLYIIQDRDGTGPVKIGITNHPTQRLASHRKKTKRNMGFYAKFRVGCQFEAFRREEWLINAFERHRAGQGDWFNIDPNLAKLLYEVRYA